MTCQEIAPGVIVCRPGGANPPSYRFVGHCPVCKRNRRFVGTWGGIWYGERQTCLGCGDSWESGEMLPRPFQRAWRDKERKEAREKWAHALTPREWRAFRRRKIAEEFAALDEVALP